MAIKVKCAGCGKTLEANEELQGKRAKCPACGQLLVIPRIQAETARVKGPEPFELGTPAASGRSFGTQTLTGLDLRATLDLTGDVVSLVAKSTADQTLITSSRGIQLRRLAGDIQKAMQDARVAKAKGIVVTGEDPASWERAMTLLRRKIREDPKERRIIVAQGVRPPFTDLFTVSDTSYTATVIRTDLTGYKRMLEVADMVNAPRRASGTFHCLVPFKEQSDITSNERTRLGSVIGTPKAAEQLIGYSRALEEYLESGRLKELATREPASVERFLRKLRDGAGLMRRRDDEGLDKLIEAAVTAIMWEEGYMYWVRKDSAGKYLSHVAGDRDGIALPNVGFADMNMETMIAIKHGAGSGELAQLWATVKGQIGS